MSVPDTSSSPIVAENSGEKQEDSRLVQANKLFHTGFLLIYGPRKSVDRAIKCIQRAITFVDDNYKYWQLLGEAYYQRGSLNPAINCFLKSLKLVDDSKEVYSDEDEKRVKAECVYSRLRMSDIRLNVGHLDQAAIGYSDIIACDPCNVAALIGLSRTQLQLARNSFSSGLIRLGHSQCIQALKNAIQAVKLCPHLCLTWKLASDCCLIQFMYGQKGHFQEEIVENFPGSDESNVLLLDRKSCIRLAVQFLCKALDIQPFQKSGCLWHNLGISLYLQSTICHKESSERDILLKRSFKCLLKALDCDRDSSQIKNSLGVVAFNLNLLNTAQTFLIKSIQTNMSTSEIQFSNLGYMYLQKGEYRLASVAFSRCQAEEPLYFRSWLGYAYINELHNQDNISQLRHCHKLECNYDSQLMFATKVVSLPNTEEHQRDLINALDCMKRIINYDEQSMEANNTLGLIYERCNNPEQSKLFFDRAFTISPQDSRVVFNRLRQTCASNSCFSPEVGDDADFIKTTEKLINVGNRDYILNFIFYLFNNSDYKNVNSKMTKFIDKLPQDDLKSKVGAQILLGLAAKANDGDFKSWLFKNIIDLDNRTCLEAIINLLCLMLLGAIINDDKLVEQITDDLSQNLIKYISSKPIQFACLYSSNEGYWIKLTMLCSIFCLKDQGKLIRPFLALFPTIPELWLYLGLAHIFQKTKSQTAVFCINKAHLIGSTCANLGFVCDILLAILSQGNKIKTETIESRDKYLSRAIYKYPNYGLLWSLLKLQSSPKKGPDSKEKVKKSYNLFTEDNSSLLYLAIDHTLKMIRT